jgi:hypothetical protein
VYVEGRHETVVNAGLVESQEKMSRKELIELIDRATGSGSEWIKARV